MYISQIWVYIYILLILYIFIHIYIKHKHRYAAAATAKSLQSCPTPCEPIDGSPPGSPIPGILLARTLEWVAISFSNAWKWKVKVKSLSRVRLFATPWIAVRQASLSITNSQSSLRLTSIESGICTHIFVSIYLVALIQVVYELKHLKQKVDLWDILQNINRMLTYKIP